MRARWIDRWPVEGSRIGQAVVASWWPGRYYFVSTILNDGSSPMARLAEAIKAGKPFEQVASAPKRYLTNIYRCTKDGIVRNEQFDRPLFNREYATVTEAQKGHELTLVFLGHGDWTALRALLKLNLNE